MADVDVSVSIDIAAAPADVAAVMFDPVREPEWMRAVTGVEVIDAALVPGARVRHTGRFLGRDLAWVTEVEAVHFPHLLRLRIDDGPFTGTVTYQIQRAPGGTTATVRNIGQPKGGSVLPAAIVAAPMRSALAGDLGRLKQIVEQEHAETAPTSA